MDFNYLYHRRGQSLMMAVRAASEPARQAHISLAHRYVERIRDLRRQHAASLPLISRGALKEQP